MTGWERAAHVLCIRLEQPGDVLATTPAIRALAQSLRGRRITLLASPSGARAARSIPEVDDVIAYDAPWLANAVPPGALADLAMRYALALRRFDAAVVFTGRGQDALPAATLCRLAGIPLRLAHCREHPGDLLTHWQEEDAGPVVRHEAQRQLDLVATVGARTDDERLSFAVRPQASWRVRMKLEEAGLEVKRPWLVIHPAAPADSRRWCAEHFGEMADLLAQVLDVQVVITGDAAQRGLCEAVRRRAGRRAWNLAGHFALEELAAALDMAALVVTNDAHAVHLAAAVQTAVVVPDAPANVPHAPWRVANRVLAHGVTVRDAVADTCDLWLDIHWRAAA